MTSPSSPRPSQLPLLVRLSGRRLSATLRRPTLRVVVGAGLPLLVLLSALATLGRVGVPGAADAAGGLTIGMLIAGTLSFLAYGVLFGAADNLFLRRLAVEGRALFLERSARLSVLGAGAVVALAVPYLSAGEPLWRPVWIGIASASITVGIACLAYAWAARASAYGDAGFLSAGIRQWDPGLARAAPLVYAPLLPFLAGSAAGALAGSATGAIVLIAVTALATGGLASVTAAMVFAPVAGRFLPQAVEMSYSPPPEGEGEGFRIGRGLSALLPRRAAAVWVRDAAVGHRRFGWAARVTWPVGVVSIVALARWGDSTETHVWVLSAVGLALLIQAAAVVGLGLVERGGPRWLDRAVGISSWERFLGRWTWSWGLSLWLLVPTALAWSWWSGADGAYLWPVAGAFTAAVATAASLLNSERR